MTASQRPERVDRAALIEAATVQLETTHWDGQGCGTNGSGGCSRCYGPSPASADEVGREVLDAILPLIADAIEEAGRAEVQFLARDDTQLGRYRLIGAEDAYHAAIRLVRSLGGEQ